MTVTERLATFALWALDETWQGHDLDGDEIERKALALGLIKEVNYDPAIHGEAEIYVEPGELWAVINDDVLAVFKQ